MKNKSCENMHSEVLDYLAKHKFTISAFGRTGNSIRVEDKNFGIKDQNAIEKIHPKILISGSSNSYIWYIFMPDKYAKGSTIKGDKNIGKIIQMRKTADWFKVVTKRNDEDLYGKKKPNYTIIDVSKLKNGKIIANINHTEIEGFDDWSSKYEMVNSLPIKYKQAFDKLTDKYNVYAKGGGVGTKFTYSIGGL